MTFRQNGMFNDISASKYLNQSPLNSCCNKTVCLTIFPRFPWYFLRFPLIRRFLLRNNSTCRGIFFFSHQSLLCFSVSLCLTSQPPLTALSLTLSHHHGASHLCGAVCAGGAHSDAFLYSHSSHYRRR